jgi:hypothetical protein
MAKVTPEDARDGRSPRCQPNDTRAVLQMEIPEAAIARGT